MRLSLFFLLFLIGFSSLYAQEKGKPDLLDKKDGGTKKKGLDVFRERDTLKTYHRNWLIAPNNLPQEMPVDTLLNSFQIDNPLYKRDFLGASSNTGNMGSARKSNLFSEPINNHTQLFYSPLQSSIYKNDVFFFFKPYANYALFSSDCLFQHTNKPYTTIFYSMSGQKIKEEQHLQFFHTQNVNKMLNIGLNFNVINSIGMYTNQRVQSNSIQLFSSFVSHWYDLHAVVSINRFKNQENGGVLASSDMKETPSVIPVTFDASKSYNRNTNLTIVQRFNLGKMIYIQDTTQKKIAKKDSIQKKINSSDSLKHKNSVLKDTLKKSQKLFPDSLKGFERNPNQLTPVRKNVSPQDTSHSKFGKEKPQPDTFPKMRLIPSSSIVHRFEYETDTHIYEDNSTNKTFYASRYFPDSLGIKDSIRFRTIRNTIEWLLPTNPLRRIAPNSGIRVGAGIEINRFYNLVSYVEPTASKNFSTSFLFGNLFKNEGKNFRWNLESKIYQTGWRKGDVALDGEVKFIFNDGKDSSLVAISGMMERKTPDFVEQNYYSTYFRWSNSFKQQYQARWKACYSNPKWKFSAGGEFATLNNYIYFGEDTLLHQQTDAIAVISAFVNKDFNLGNFHFVNKVVYQKTSNKNIFRLPEVLLYNSTYYEKSFFKKVLHTQIGFDVAYTPEYDAPAYCPALGQYYLQGTAKAGNYPLLDVFINAELKSVFLFFKFENMSSTFYDTKYLPIASYPMNVRAFKFGVRWKFLD